MKIETLKDLKGLIKLCRETGVQAIKVDNVEIALGPEPTKGSKALPTIQVPEAEIKVPRYNGITTEQLVADTATEELSDEQKMFWSSAPSNDSIEQ